MHKLLLGLFYFKCSLSGLIMNLQTWTIVLNDLFTMASAKASSSRSITSFHVMYVWWNQNPDCPACHGTKNLKSPIRHFTKYEPGLWLIIILKSIEKNLQYCFHEIKAPQFRLFFSRVNFANLVDRCHSVVKYSLMSLSLVWLMIMLDEFSLYFRVPNAEIRVILALSYHSSMKALRNCILCSDTSASDSKAVFNALETQILIDGFDNPWAIRPRAVGVGQFPPLCFSSRFGYQLSDYCEGSVKVATAMWRSKKRAEGGRRVQISG